MENLRKSVCFALLISLAIILIVAEAAPAENESVSNVSYILMQMMLIKRH